MSSVLALAPGVPLDAHYGASKAFLLSLAAALTAELRECADVLAVLPPPMATPFWRQAPRTATTRFLRAVAVSPDGCVDAIWRCAGRTHRVVPGIIGFLSAAVAAAVPLDAVWEVFSRWFVLLPDYAALRDGRALYGL